LYEIPGDKSLIEEVDGDLIREAVDGAMDLDACEMESYPATFVQMERFGMRWPERMPLRMWMTLRVGTVFVMIMAATMMAVQKFEDSIKSDASFDLKHWN